MSDVCTHRYLNAADGLVCDNPAQHDEQAATGHTYSSSTGSHLSSAHGQEQADDE